MSLTQERVRELFDYRDGDLIRKKPSQGVKVGDVAGSLGNRGYLGIRIDYKNYLNHVLVWLWHHGYIPEHDIDHIDRIKIHNQIENLREVSRTCNSRNSKLSKKNTSGVKGVSWKSGENKWVAQIMVNYKTIALGRTLDFTEAVSLRLAAEQCLNWDGCDSSSPAFKFIKYFCGGE
jgi:hypothetical protein